MLVVPAKGDPGGLLARGACSSAPPICSRSWHEDHWVSRWVEWESDEALPLWWDGALVPEGWDRLVRAQRRASDSGPLYPPEPAMAWINVATTYAVWIGLASRVVLVDADGREVTP